MDYHLLPRKDLQLLCKKHGIPANRTNVFMADALAKKRVPLIDIGVNREADNDLFVVTPLKVSAAKVKDDVNGAMFNNTPFLRRGTKKKEGAPNRSSDGAEERVEVIAAAPSHGSRLLQDGIVTFRSRKAATERTEPKPCTSSAGATGATGALKQSDDSKTGTSLTLVANAEVLGNKEVQSGGKAAPHQSSLNGAFELQDNGSNGSYTLETRRSSSESSFTAAQDIQHKKVEISGEEAGFVSDTGQTDQGQDSSVEGNQRDESKPGRSETPPRQRYIVKVTFADDVSIMSKGSGGVEKERLNEFKLRRPDILPITNGGYAVKSKLDTRPFVFRATTQEETKPRRSRETTDLKGRAESKGSIAGALKQDESKARRAGSEGKEFAAVAKVKPEAKASAVLVSSSYLKPSKRPRLGSGSSVANDLNGMVEIVHSSPTNPAVEVADPFEFPATCSEFKIVDLPEWAKEIIRKREESSSSAVAHTPDGSTNVKMAPSPAPGLSPLKKIEDRVVKLLDRLKGFCWKAEVNAVTLETEVANGVETVVEGADHVEVDHPPTQEGELIDHSD